MTERFRVRTPTGTKIARRLKQYATFLQYESMSAGFDTNDDSRVYMKEVDDTLVVKVLCDDYAGRKKAEQLQEYIEECLTDDD
jgi:hypothetical protein